MQRVAPEVLHGHETWRWYGSYFRDPMETLAVAQRRFGPVFALGSPIPFCRGGLKHVVALGADANRQVLGQPDLFRPSGPVMKGPRGSAHRRLRGGILTMHGDEHRCHRRIMHPPFARTAVATYTSAIADLVDRYIDQWPVGEPFDMFDEMLTLTNWIVANVLFGNEDFAKSIKIGRLVDRWIIDGQHRKFVLRLNLPGTPFRRLLRHAEVLETAMLELVESRRKASSDGNDVLSIIIRNTGANESDMRDTDLIAHLTILHGAGFVTTASALAWTMFLIAQSPSIAVELDDEIHERLTDWPPDNQQLESLPLLDGVVRESLRLMPPIPQTVRTATEPVDLAGIPMKREDKVILSAYFTHRVPEIFPHPDRFDPSRWFTIMPGPYEYIPFSGSPRLCLGYSFATLEMKLIVARVMQRYRFGVVPNSRIDAVCQTSLRPRPGLPMTVYSKNKAFAASPVTGNILNLIEQN